MAGLGLRLKAAKWMLRSGAATVSRGWSSEMGKGVRRFSTETENDVPTSGISRPLAEILKVKNWEPSQNKLKKQSRGKSLGQEVGKKSGGRRRSTDEEVRAKKPGAKKYRKKPRARARARAKKPLANGRSWGEETGAKKRGGEVGAKKLGRRSWGEEVGAKVGAKKPSGGKETGRRSRGQ
ncbi:hypothetical protein ARALYDRAFT_887607 [Arabidopsis lyrata subsp. lyrata]|uniref:Uncharacterized protein n=1 Tax=Arabidopsis lyrata subsp. lyrata TaxID=81972 RepID=D7KDE5_ARALL|nr:hypothetical protein ARALYDRAFT_887607 [Arabidopsis lyrata subsp. lyrata]